MKMKPRIPAMILAALLAVTLLSACGGNAKPTETQTAEATQKSTEATKPETSAEESTAVPTTAEPTTEAPTTAEPTTETPTTEAPTTAEPTTEEAADQPSKGLKEYVFDGVVCWIPENYTEKENSYPLSLIPAGKTQGSNITLITANDKYEDYTEEAFKNAITNSYASSYGAEVKDFTYTSKDIQGGKLVIAHYTADFVQQGVVLKQTSCTLFMEGRSVTITYTADNDEMDKLFQSCSEHIHVQ